MSPLRKATAGKEPQPKLCARCLNILVAADGALVCPKGHEQP